MIYLLRYVGGGPKDGAEAMSPRPYDSTWDDGGHVYQADGEGTEVLEWVDDDQRAITLRYRGVDPQRRRRD